MEKKQGKAVAGRPGTGWLIGMLVALAVVGFACYQMGVSSTKATYEDEQNTERAYAAALAQSYFERLDLDGETIYVTGHQHPDADTVCSAIGYAALLRELGYDAQAVTLGEINNETAFILDAAGVEVPPVLEDASGLNVALVDHANIEQSAPGIEDANIVGVADHHSVGNITTTAPITYEARPLGATATVIWMNYGSLGIKLDESMACVLLGAVLSDTGNLQSNATTEADRMAAEALAKVAGVEDVDAFYHDLLKASLSHEGQSDEEIFLSDLKEYESGGTSFAIGVVSVWDEDEAKDMAARMVKVMATEREALGVDLLFCQVAIFHDGINAAYLVPADERAQAVLEEGFGDMDTVTFDGTSYVATPGFSRRSVTEPVISEVLLNHPRE